MHRRDAAREDAVARRVDARRLRACICGCRRAHRVAPDTVYRRHARAFVRVERPCNRALAVAWRDESHVARQRNELSDALHRRAYRVVGADRDHRSLAAHALVGGRAHSRCGRQSARNAPLRLVARAQQGDTVWHSGRVRRAVGSVAARSHHFRRCQPCTALHATFHRGRDPRRRRIRRWTRVGDRRGAGCDHADARGIVPRVPQHFVGLAGRHARRDSHRRAFVARAAATWRAR